MLSQLKSEDNDGIYYKVRDSIRLIKNELEFGGTQEKEELVRHMHFFVVYEGKNNVAVQTTIKLPGKALPRAGKAVKGKGKVRAFSIFSAQNFAEIVEKGFFDEWNWGEYQDSFVPVNTEQTTEDQKTDR